MTLHAPSAAQGGLMPQSQVRPGGATLAPLRSHLGPLQECSVLSNEFLEQICLAELKMGTTTSSPQDAINISCLPEEFVEGLRSVAEVKKHEKNGRYELGDPGELPDVSPSKVTVFVDVDETIVYVTPIPLLKVPADRTFVFSEPGGEDGASKAYTATPLPPVSLEEAAAAAENFDPNASKAILYVYHRPFAKRLLTELRESGKFEIVAFTAALPEYANPILDTLEDDGKLFDHRLYRNHCCRAPRTRSSRHEVHGTMGVESHWPFAEELHYYVKDLANAAKNRDLRRCVLLDNSPVSFAAQMENGIYLRPFCGDPGDDELQFLSNMLFQLHKLEDVRVGLQTGLINAAWRSLVEQDDLYELAGIPRPTPESVNLGEEMNGPSTPKEELRPSREEAGEVRREFSEMETAAVTVGIPYADATQKVVESEKAEAGGPSAMPKRQAANGQEQMREESRNRFSVSPKKAISSPASVDTKKESSSSSSTRRSGDAGKSQVSLKVPSEARRTLADHSPVHTPQSSRSTRRRRGDLLTRRKGPQTPRSTNQSTNERDVDNYNICYEVGRARVEAAETRSVVDSCRRARNFGGDSRKSSAISSVTNTQTTDDRGHTISCLKRQEREGTTWCTCTGAKSAGSRMTYPENFRRPNTNRLVPAFDSTDGMRHASERRRMSRIRKTSRETVDAVSVCSSSCSISSARGGGGNPPVPRLHLQGLVGEGRRPTADWSSECGAGEEPLTPGKQPLTPNARKARLAHIEQILEDSVALSRQCPEPMAQSRNRLKQPATMYGCPDVQAPNLLCSRQEEGQHAKPQRQSRPRPRDRQLKGREGAESARETAPATPLPLGASNTSCSSVHPSMRQQYPEYPMQNKQQQLLLDADREQMAYAQPLGTPRGGEPSTPHFREDSARGGAFPVLIPRGQCYAQETIGVSGPTSGYRGPSALPQVPLASAERCATPVKEYASLMQQVSSQSNLWGASPANPSGFWPCTPEVQMGQQATQQPTAVPPAMMRRTMANVSSPQQEPRLFAGRRMRLGELFGWRDGGQGQQPATKNFQMEQMASDAHQVRPAMLVRREGPPNSSSPGGQQRGPSSPPAVRPFISYGSPIGQMPQGKVRMQPEGPAAFVALPQQPIGPSGRVSPPPSMLGSMRSSCPLSGFYPTYQERGQPQMGFAVHTGNWQWMPPTELSNGFGVPMPVFHRFS